jgi:hypothetical protein
MKILLATPAYDATVTASCYRSVIALILRFRETRPDVQLEISVLSFSSVTHARNLFATRILLDPSFSHLLFVDADMGFRPELIEKMIDWNKPVVGAFYPYRDLRDDDFHRQSRRIGNANRARLAAQKFVGEEVLFEEQKAPHRVQRGFVQVSAAGTGIMLIQRQVVEALRDRYPELWAGDWKDEQHTGLFQCFHPVQDKSGCYVGEDISFCRRWVEGCGGEIWSCASEPIAHVGRKVYQGRFIDRLEAKFGTPSPPPQAEEVNEGASAQPPAKSA